MYAVITCAHCKQVVQVAETSLGKLVRCPLCSQPTLAEVKPSLPVAEPLPEAVAEQEKPLSLDDAEQLPVKPRPADRVATGLQTLPPLPPTPATKPRSPLRLGLQIGASLTLTLLAVAAVYAFFRYGSGEIPDGAWEDFRPPGGSCLVKMPGEPDVQDISAEAYASIGGKRCTKRRWFEDVTFTLAWIDFEAEKFRNNTTFEQAVMAERDREAKRLKGKVTRDVRANFTVGTNRRFEGQEVDIEYEGGKSTLRYLMEKEAAQPRLYILSVAGPKVQASHPTATRFMNSFVPEG